MMDGPRMPVCFVLHAHLPYVKPERLEETLESRWFCEAVADVYLPLLAHLEKLTRRQVPFRLALSLTPTLLAMLEDEAMNAFAELHLKRLAELSLSETKRLRDQPQLGETAQLYAERYRRLHRFFLEIGGGRGWLKRIGALSEQGLLELMASAATHAFLPLLKTKEARRAQLAAGRAEHIRIFGKAPAGIWLPECGYTPELDPLLKELGYAYTVAELGELNAGAVKSPGGIALLGRDAKLSDHIWNAERGYPGHEAYRDYYRDIGFESDHDGTLPKDYLRPYRLADGTPVSTGMKYYRVTDRLGGPKQPYRRDLALAAAARHAEQFWRELTRCKSARKHGPEAPGALTRESERSKAITVCAFDAELFGHWWFEGGDFLEALFRRAARDAQRRPVGFATPSEALSAGAAESLPAAAAGPSSWGRGGYADVWLQPKTDWMYPLLHEAEERMTRAAETEARRLGAGAGADGAAKQRGRALTEAARELLLAQSSDWAFWLDAGTMPTAAQRRFSEHLDRFYRLLSLWEQEDCAAEGRGGGGAAAVRSPEAEAAADAVTALEPGSAEYGRYACNSSSLLPSLQWQWYLPTASGASHSGAGSSSHHPFKERRAQGSLRILMLAWEYPPHVVGGLGKAVGDLSRELAALGHDVHVITRAPDPSVSLPPQGVPEQGVIVHRVPVLQSLQPVSFLRWTLQMNVAFADCAARLMAGGASFDVLHAHDWLVCAAAVELTAAYGVPLVATMHATEHGRRAGKLTGPLSPRLHELEARLVAAADEIIVCSEAMRAELAQLFAPAQPRIIPCGHRPPHGMLPAPPEAAGALPPRSAQAPVLAFLGRLVPEKGVQVLVRALPLLLREYPRLTLVIAGEGPLRTELEAQAAPFGERVRFAGFLAGDAKAALLARADVCVMPSLYEPFGLVALEAMAAGTPLIASAVGGLAEIVSHGVNGLICPPGEAERLAAAILRLLRSPALARRLASAAQRTVRERYAPERIAAETVRVYKDAIRQC